MDKINFKILALILLVLAIGLSPSFPAGKLSDGKIIELRIEDFLMVIFGLTAIAGFLISGKKKIERPPLLLPILALLSVGLISILINFILTNLSLDKGFFYLLKDVQYFFLFFYFFYCIKDIKSAKFILKTWFFVAAVNIIYVFYQVLTEVRAGNIYQFLIKQPISSSDYGASAFAEEGALPRGMFFLLIFVFLINIFLYYFLNSKISKLKKTFLGLIAISPAIGVFYSGSRTSFLGLIFALLLIIIFLIFKKRSFKLFCIIIFTLVLISITFLYLPKDFSGPQRIINTILSGEKLIKEIYRSRIESGVLPTFERAMSKKNYLLPFFGFGKGAFGEAHNQYLLNFISIGIVGSFIFFVLIFFIIKKSFISFLKNKDSFSIGLSIGLLIATLVMLFCSLASDPFMVVKSAEVYWVFVGITMAVIKINRKK